MNAIRTKRTDYEVTKLRRAMLDADLDSKELATNAGVNIRCLQNLLSGGNRSWPLRAKLNKYFKLQIFNPAFRRHRGRPIRPRTRNP